MVKTGGGRSLGEFVKGDIVVMPFPFSDLSNSKKRPAIVLADLKGQDLILSQITSKGITDEYAVKIDTTHFEVGSLNKESNIRPNKIFTADKNIILYKIGHLKSEKMDQITNRVIKILMES